MRWTARIAPELRALRFTILVYLATRALLLGVALVMGAVEHNSLASEVGRWDGTWYVQVASSGYPRHISHYPTTLGFFPLYPLVIWLTVHAPGPPDSVVLAGMLISGAGGLVATVLVQRLAAVWWGAEGGRRAAVLFCLFPGSIVFSMVYAEGLLLPLAAGCLLALQRRRWLLAGVLAGFATAVQPDAVALIVVLAVCAVRELRVRGWLDRDARRSVIALLLSGAGICAFALFLWLRTGTPFATLEAQHYGWGEKVDPLALVHQGHHLVSELSHAHLQHLNLNLGPFAALIGAVVLAIGFTLLFKSPRTVSLEAMAWTLSVGLLAVVSENVAPNPRILITAFPAVLVFAYYCRHKRYTWLLSATSLLLVLTSAVTYGGRSMTP